MACAHVRRNRLMLTAAGERLLPQVTDAFHTISQAVEDIAPALKGRMFRLGVAPELLRQGSRLSQTLKAPPPGLRLRLSKAHDIAALHEGAADAILRTSDGPYPSYNVERVTPQRFGLPVSANLVTQPGLAGCHEHRALLSLLRGS